MVTHPADVAVLTLYNPIRMELEVSARVTDIFNIEVSNDRAA